MFFDTKTFRNNEIFQQYTVLPYTLRSSGKMHGVNARLLKKHPGLIVVMWSNPVSFGRFDE